METVAGRWAAGGSLALGPPGQNPPAVARLQEGGYSEDPDPSCTEGSSAEEMWAMGGGRALAALLSPGKGRLGESRPPEGSRLCSREGEREPRAGGSRGRLLTGSVFTATPTAGRKKPR